MPDERPNDKDGPGPANYYLPSTVGHNNHDISKSRSPSFSMGLRLPGLFCEQNVQSPSPGPKYQVENLTKYGRSNVVSSNSNLKAERPRSCLGRISRNRSTDRSIGSNDVVTQKNSSNVKAQLNVRKHNSCERRKSIKVGDSKIVNLNNELRAFCRQFEDISAVPASRMASAKRNSRISPRYRSDIRHPRY